MTSTLLAHAGEDHESSLEAAQHGFELNPFISTVLAFMIITIFTISVLKLTKSSTAATFSLLAQLLVVGLFTYSALPIVSGICIVLGFLLSMVLSFGGFYGKK